MMLNALPKVLAGQLQKCHFCLIRALVAAQGPPDAAGDKPGADSFNRLQQEGWAGHVFQLGQVLAECGRGVLASHALSFDLPFFYSLCFELFPLPVPSRVKVKNGLD